jgi:hypothetical protein
MNITKRQTITLLRKVQKFQIEMSNVSSIYLTINVHTPDADHKHFWFNYSATIDAEHIGDACYNFRTYEHNLKVFEEFKEKVLSYIK